jgi:hypothetical protein
MKETTLTGRTAPSGTMKVELTFGVQYEDAHLDPADNPHELPIGFARNLIHDNRARPVQEAVEVGDPGVDHGDPTPEHRDPLPRGKTKGRK